MLCVCVLALIACANSGAEENTTDPIVGDWTSTAVKQYTSADCTDAGQDTGLQYALTFGQSNILTVKVTYGGGGQNEGDMTSGTWSLVTDGTYTVQFKDPVDTRPDTIFKVTLAGNSLSGVCSLWYSDPMKMYILADFSK